MSAPAQERALENWLASGLRFIGQIAIDCLADGTFVLTHRDDVGRPNLAANEATNAVDVARFDDAGNYRPLKTAPNLRHGWKLKVRDVTTLRLTLDCFYPGRLAVFLAFQQNELSTTPFRETLSRQTGMYRIAAQVSDDQANGLVGDFCRSDSGCLRTILWQRDQAGSIPSTKLPPEKFDPRHDQTGGNQNCIPLLCQEPCNLLVAETRRVVQETR